MWEAQVRINFGSRRRWEYGSLRDRFFKNSNGNEFIAAIPFTYNLLEMAVRRTRYRKEHGTSYMVRQLHFRGSITFSWLA